ncbi:zinc-finger domain-containing protein [Bacillus sp. A015]|uniref:Zinc-finger domain-containing protein n=1 Tax=Bacillus pumilus TaxID=1408 RepID=A0A2G8IQA8_BACPU|nr:MULTISPECIES: zinc-finger domain-containing protein [Bacillus]MCC9087516.1 zinc-finger domain-containing protein [Bacillus pumilus]MED1747828.1 zinc-finger domain-containing protein [Bacillus zhangzhouensis]PIK25705.1 zinc-finger domain-containing protein [Bacillus pumilus]UUD41165.1 zinc-finger domain-containing protein [Bacillus pumilus]
MDKKTAVKELTDLQDTYCSDCFIKKHFRKEFGKKYAHSFCIQQCTVGEKIKEYGNALLKK